MRPARARQRRGADSPDRCNGHPGPRHRKRLRRNADSPASKHQGPPCNTGGLLNRCRAEARQREVHRDSRPPTTRRGAMPSVDRPNEQRVARCRNNLLATARYDFRRKPHRSTIPFVGRRPSLTHDAEATCARTELQSDSCCLPLSAETPCGQQQRRPGVAQHPTNPKACQVPGGSRCPPRCKSLPKQPPTTQRTNCGAPGASSPSGSYSP